MSRSWRGARSSQREDGASALEFALVAPFLFMFLFAIVSFGVILAQMMALNNGAREGARFGVVDEKTCSQIASAARDASSAVAVNTASVTVSVKRGQTAASATNACASGPTKPCSGSATGDSIYVTTAYDSSLLVPVPGVRDTVRLSGTGVFRCEFS